MTAFSKAWGAAFEADPADGDAASGGALDIRDTRHQRAAGCRSLYAGRW